MYNEIDFTQLGGMYFNQDQLAKMQTSYKSTIEALIGLFGDKVIITGCETSGNNITSGWIIYAGELLPFTGGAAKSRVALQTTTANEFFDDGSQKPVYTSKALVLADTGGFAFSDLKRATPYQYLFCKGDLKDVICDAAYIAANFDSTGLGKNERTGWAICNGQNGTIDMGGRVTVGYTSVTVDPGDNVWDILYNTIGSLAGEKKHKLAIAELPSLQFQNGVVDDKPIGDSQNIFVYGQTNTDLPGKAKGNVGNTAGGGNVLYQGLTNKLGGDLSHENRQPFVVALKIMKL